VVVAAAAALEGAAHRVFDDPSQLAGKADGGHVVLVETDAERLGLDLSSPRAPRRGGG
jgi:hypothetical protein